MGDMNQRIVLQTTPGEDIPGFLAMNGRCRTCNHMIIRLPFKDPDTLEALPRPEGLCECAEPAQVPVYGTEQEYEGMTLVIAGAGPSLRQAHKVIRKADHVWGCNRAANWLVEKGWHCTHAIGIDAGTSMYEDCWADPPVTEQGYILATSVNPALVDHILEHDLPVRFFHSIRGQIAEELDLYQIIFPPAPIAGNGLNVVNRALDLADFLGYRKVYLAGCDLSLGMNDQMYATGARLRKDRHAIVQGKVNGQAFRTKPDMLMSARSFAEMKITHWGDRLEFVGQTLPKALYHEAKRDPTYLERVIKWDYDDPDAGAEETPAEAVV